MDSDPDRNNETQIEPTAPIDHDPDCPLCCDEGGTVVYRTDNWRIVLVHEPRFPGYTRVIWNRHRREMTDLSPPERREILEAVMAVEALMHKELIPDKVNLASLGNEVAHVHWHVIPRWRADSHFPRPIWAEPVPGRGPATLIGPAALARWRTALGASFTAAPPPVG